MATIPGLEPVEDANSVQSPQSGTIPGLEPVTADKNTIPGLEPVSAENRKPLNPDDIERDIWNPFGRKDASPEARSVRRALINGSADNLRQGMNWLAYQFHDKFGPDEERVRARYKELVDSGNFARAERMEPLLAQVELSRQKKDAISRRTRELQKEINDKVQRDRVDGFFTWDLPNIGAQVATVVGAGAVASPLAFATGVVQAGGGGIQDALSSADRPVTDEELQLTGNLNAALGIGSGFVAVRQLKRLGVFEELAKNYQKAIANSAGLKAVTGRAQSALENALQETLEQVGGNYVASDVVGYDPNRSLDDQLFEAAKGGATAGVMIDLILGGAKYGHTKLTKDEEGRTRWERAKKMEQSLRLQKALQGGQFSDIQGPFTDVKKYLDLKKEESDLLLNRKPDANMPPELPKTKGIWELAPEADKKSTRYVLRTDDAVTDMGGDYGAIVKPTANGAEVEILVPGELANADPSLNAVYNEDEDHTKIFKVLPSVQEAFNFAESTLYQESSLYLKGGQDDSVPGTKLDPSKENFWRYEGKDQFMIGPADSPVAVLTMNPGQDKHTIRFKNKEGKYEEYDFYSDSLQDTLVSAFDLVNMEMPVGMEPLVTPTSVEVEGFATFGSGGSNPVFPGHFLSNEEIAGRLETLHPRVLDQMGVDYQLIADANGVKVKVDPDKPFFKGPRQTKYPVVTYPNTLRTDVENADRMVKEAEEQLKLPAPTKGAEATRKSRLENLKKQRTRAKKKLAAAKSFGVHAARIGRVVEQMLGGKHQIVIQLRPAVPQNGAHETILHERMSVVTVDYDPIKFGKPEDQAELYHTLYHELGHAVEAHYLRKSLERIRDENPKEYAALVEELTQLHIRWAHQKAQEPLSALSDDFQNKMHMFAGQYKLDDVTLSSKHMRYYLRAEEFFAELFAEAITSGTIPMSVTLSKFNKEVTDNMRKTYEAMTAGSDGKRLLSYTNSFTDFLKVLTLRGEQQRELERIADKSETRIEAAKKMLFPLDDKGNSPPNATWDRESFDEWVQSHERYNAFIGGTYNLILLADINSHLQELGEYVGIQRTWHAIRTQRARIADEITKRIRKLGRNQSNILAKWILEEDRTGKYIDISDPATVQKMGLTSDMIAAREDIKNMFLESLKLARESSERLIRETYADKPEERAAELARLEQEFSEMEQRPYFPHMRYGHWTVTVRNKNGDVVAMYAAETKFGQQLEKRRAEVEWGAKGEQVKIATSRLTDEMRMLQGMPGFFLRQLKTKLPGLTKEQTDILDFMIQENSPVRGYKQRWLARRGIEGYSEDIIRGINSFAIQWASHTARTEYAPLAQDAVSRLRQVSVIKRMAGQNTNALDGIINHLTRHLDYMLNPKNEWQAVRSFVFAMTLWGNIKSAVINAASIPLVTYPYLSSRFGHDRTAAAMNWAVSQMGQLFGNPDNADPRVKALIEWGMNQGIIDQSLMVDAAVASTEYSQHKNPLLPPAKQLAYQLNYLGAVPFQAVEKMNRYLTGISAAKLMWDNGESDHNAFAFARTAIDSTQNENARWNNPEWLRGRKGALLPFQKYIWNQVGRFAFGNDPSTLRWFLVLGMMAGMTGLPFAEDAMDLIEGLASYFRKHLGLKNPKAELMAEGHELVGRLGADPELAFHGLARDTFGVGFLADKMGTPMPSFDLSGSISFGNIIPGTRVLKELLQGRDMTGSDVAGSLMQEGGATTSGVLNIIGALSVDNPDTWAQAEVGLPAVAKNVSKAARFAAKEGVFAKDGTPIAEFDTMDPVARAELFGLALGFQPTRVSEGYERFQWGKSAAVYYITRRQNLMEQYNFARYTKDREALAAIRKKIQVFDATVPYPELKVMFSRDGSNPLARSYEDYVKNKALRKAGAPVDIRTYRLQKQYEGAQDGAQE